MKTEEFFRGKSVLITGGSSGIGFAIANTLAEMDAIVILLARDYEKLKAAKSSILEKYPKARVKLVSADVTDAQTLIELHEKYVRNHDTPDILINCAGVARPGYVEEIPLDVYKWTMDIDYHGTVNTIKVLLPGMIERGSGHIVNFSSIAGVIGVFGDNGARLVGVGRDVAVVIEEREVPVAAHLDCQQPADTARAL